MDRMYIAEVLGTFALVFSGCGAIIVNDISGGSVGHVGVCIVFGLVVMAMIYALGDISGAHINPAVTIALFFAKRLDRRLVLPYIISQFSGAIIAAAVLRLLFPEHATLGSTLPTIPLPSAFAMEILLSFFLMFVVLTASSHKQSGVIVAIAVGGIVALNALFAGPVTGASMNPARSLGPALLSLNLDEIWLYLSAPVVGTCLAWPVCRWLQRSNGLRP